MLSPRGVAVILISLLVSVAALSTTVLPGYAVAPQTASQTASQTAPETWPPSSELVIAEVVTGGASASDEYVEIYNAGSGPTDLGGCELDYVTASGATTTRKAVFASPLPLVAGQYLLVANSAGVYGPLADATYVGGACGGRGIAGSAPSRRCGDRRGWLGDGGQFPRRRCGRSRATGPFEPGAPPRRHRRKLDRHQRQRVGLGRAVEPGASIAGLRAAAGPIDHTVANLVLNRHRSRYGQPNR